MNWDYFLLQAIINYNLFFFISVKKYALIENLAQGCF